MTPTSLRRASTPPARVGTARAPGFFLSAVVSLVACTPSTPSELVIDVVAEPGVQRDASGVSLRLYHNGAQVFRGDLTEPTWPVRHVVRGSGGEEVLVEAVAVSSRGEGAAVRARATVPTRAAGWLVLTLPDACLAPRLPCESESTCSAEGCVAIPYPPLGTPPDTPSGRDGGTRLEADGSTFDQCVPACASGVECVDGVCVSGVDLDDDGVDAGVDCDDTDASVGSTGSRECTSACGTGVERCVAGSWSSCSAPEDCDCTPSSPPRTVGCGNCGRQQQVCDSGVWTNVGDCSSEGVCLPTTVERETESCGACGLGRRERSRSCNESCVWTDWAPFGACTMEGSSECMDGEVQTEERACGNCNFGRQSRTRTCSASCSWGPWSDFSACSGGGMCAPGETRSCEGRASTCTQQVCGATCVWGGCGLLPGAQCDYVSAGGTAGGRYRCCGASRWQFCMSTCQWDTACTTCSGCGC